jgi:hypothetical protein
MKSERGGYSMGNWVLPLILLLGGLAVAFTGWRLLTLAIAFAGFLLFYNIVEFFLPEQGGWTQLIIAVIGGAIGAWLAIKFLKIFLYVMGFIFIGYATWALAGFFGVDSTLILLVVFVVGGLIGIGLVRFMFEAAIVIITALGGAAAAAYGAQLLFNIQTTGQAWATIFLVVALLGAIVQWGVLKGIKR